MVVTTERRFIPVDNLLPGNRLDTLVAVSFMHWRYMSVPAGKVSAVEWGEWVDNRGHTQYAGGDGGFHPSTDDQSAMRIVDHWADSRQGDFRMQLTNGIWTVTFFRPSEEYIATSGNRQVTICRAALRSAGITQIPA